MGGGQRAARIAAIGGSTAAAMAATGAGVLTAQAITARREAGPRRTSPPYADGRYGGNRGVSLRLAMIGDSLATGLGADYAHQTPGAMLAERLAQRSGRPVVLSTIAIVGARSDSLGVQVDRALVTRPNVAVIIIGANDITHVRPLRRQVRRLRDAILRLREAGVEVVVGTCPDLGTTTLIRRPARTVVHRQSLRLAELQTRAALQLGAITVSLGDTLGPEFRARPGELFAADRFHPNAHGYAALAEVLSPAVLGAAGLGLAGLPERYEAPRTERFRTAIDQAVLAPGTVIAPITAPPPNERRTLATLLLRRGHPQRPADRPAHDIAAEIDAQSGPPTDPPVTPRAYR